MAERTHATGHDPYLAHHFSSRKQQYESATLGMWLFLATEVLFFGGLFCAYAVYRSNHPEVFVWAHHFLDKNLGALNTVILILSSFTVAWAVRAAQLKQRGALRLMLVLTMLCAAGFLSVKYVEYSSKWKHRLLWASQYHPEHEEQVVAQVNGRRISAEVRPTATAGENAASTATEVEGTQDVTAPSGTTDVPEAAAGPPGLAAEHTAAAVAKEHQEPTDARVFFSIYFLMTGLHGIHVIGGIGAMLWLFVKAGRGHFDTGHFTPVHIVGLYWHLVDLIWIYLFLLLYLIH